MLHSVIAHPIIHFISLRHCCVLVAVKLKQAAVRFHMAAFRFSCERPYSAPQASHPSWSGFRILRAIHNAQRRTRCRCICPFVPGCRLKGQPSIRFPSANVPCFKSAFLHVLLPSLRQPVRKKLFRCISSRIPAPLAVKVPSAPRRPCSARKIISSAPRVIPLGNIEKRLHAFSVCPGCPCKGVASCRFEKALCR